MIRVITKVFLYVLWSMLVISAILVTTFFFGGKTVGMLEAWQDLSRGHHEIQGYGLTRGTPAWVYSLDLHGINYRHVADCLVNAYVIEKVASYNETMEIAIKKDLGFDVDQNLPDSGTKPT